MYKRKTTGLVLFPNSKRSRQHPLQPSRAVVAARPRIRSIKPSQFEGVRFGGPVSGSGAPEIKNSDALQTLVAVNTGAPYVASLTSGIPEGLTGASRVAQKIHVSSIDVVGNVIAQIGATASFNGTAPAFMDVFAVWDKQPDQALPAASTIFTSTATNLTFLNLAQTERFVVLRRERFAFDINGGASATFKWHIPCDMDIKFPDSTTNPNSNDIYICALSPNAALSTTTMAPAFTYDARVKFTDA